MTRRRPSGPSRGPIGHPRRTPTPGGLTRAGGDAPRLRRGLQACNNARCPGAIFGETIDALADTLTPRRVVEHQLNACGYSLGTLYPPTWMDWPMNFRDNPVVVQPNMVIFMHMILLDRDNKLAMSVGDTVITTAEGCETLTKLGQGLVLN